MISQNKTYSVTRLVFEEREPPESENDLQFRLFYQGPLPAETSKPRPQWKHRIRQQVNPQLHELWRQQQVLKGYLARNELTGVTYLQEIGKRFQRGNYHFVPLITDASGFWCSLDILFLRRDAPGNLIRHSGDIDNRLKVLFDALSIPVTTDGIPENPGEGEHPMCCLLEDDRLITDISVTTDRLLVPPSEGENESEVKLVIHVRTSSFEIPPAYTFLPELLSNAR